METKMTTAESIANIVVYMAHIIRRGYPFAYAVCDLFNIDQHEPSMEQLYYELRFLNMEALIHKYGKEEALLRTEQYLPFEIAFKNIIPEMFFSRDKLEEYFEEYYANIREYYEYLYENDSAKESYKKLACFLDALHYMRNEIN